MSWLFYSLEFLLAASLTGMAVYGLYWASRHGQLRDFSRGAASIFDAHEPEGCVTDHFPPPRARRRSPPSPAPTTGRPAN